MKIEKSGVVQNVNSTSVPDVIAYLVPHRIRSSEARLHPYSFLPLMKENTTVSELDDFLKCSDN